MHRFGDCVLRRYSDQGSSTVANDYAKQFDGKKVSNVFERFKSAQALELFRVFGWLAAWSTSVGTAAASSPVSLPRAGH
jgi:hypothetical protein